MDIKKKNKKGFALIGVTVGIAIVAAIIILMVLLFTAGFLNFLKNNILMLLGVLLLVGAVIFIIKSTGSTKFKTTVFFVLLTIGAIFVFSGGVLQEALTEGIGDYIQSPVFYYDKCEAIHSLKDSSKIIIKSKTDTFTSLQNPSVTDRYSLDFIKTDSTFSVLNRRLVYNVCPEGVFPEASSCIRFNEKITNLDGRSNGVMETISDIGNDVVVYAQIQKMNIVGEWKVDTEYNKISHQIHYKPYGLRQYNVLSGSWNNLNPDEESCTYISKQKDTLIQINGNKLNSIYGEIDEGTNQKVLQPEEVRWYVGGYVASPPDDKRFFNYNNQPAWCRIAGTSGEIYKVNTVKVESGKTYKIASSDYSDLIGTEICCPGSTRGDEVCNDNFEYESILESEPGPFGSCGSPNWVPYDEKKIIKYFKDDNGICQQEINNVECASSYDCRLTNEVCNTNTWTCVAANVNLQGESYSGQNIEPEESKCSPLEESVEVNKEYKKGIFSIFGLGKTVTETSVVCKTKDAVKWVIIGAIILGLGLTAILVNKPKRQSRRRRRR